MLDFVCSFMVDVWGREESICQSFHWAIIGDPLPIGLGLFSIAILNHACVKP